MPSYKVDKYKLEDEAAEQPDLMYKATKPLAGLFKKKKKLSKKLKELESSSFLKIKKDPKKYFEKLEKPPTDAAINKMVDTLPEVKKLGDKLIEVEYTFMKASNNASAVESRRSMIKYMEELYTSEYWSITKVSDDVAISSDLSEAKANIKKKNKKKGRKKL